LVAALPRRSATGPEQQSQDAQQERKRDGQEHDCELRRALVSLAPRHARQPCPLGARERVGHKCSLRLLRGRRGGGGLWRRARDQAWRRGDGRGIRLRHPPRHGRCSRRRTVGSGHRVANARQCAARRWQMARLHGVRRALRCAPPGRRHDTGRRQLGRLACHRVGERRAVAGSGG
jgi:hypothetical protein